MKNANKNNTVVTFDTIEKTVANMTIGTKCGYSKYNDNRNGYIGIKCGKPLVISMFGLRNDNDKTKSKNVGVTTEVFNLLKSQFTDKNIEYIENGNSSDKTRNNKVVAPFETIIKMFEYVVKWYSTPTTATATTK